MALDLVAELEAVIALLEREQIEFAICGGIAMSIHGHVRATIDIDLLIRAADLARTKDLARSLGFDVPARTGTFGLKTGQPHTVERVSKLDPETKELMPLDLLAVEPVFEEVWADRVAIEYHGHRLTVVSREGLATMKRMSGRPQDLADVAALEGSDGDEG